MLGASLDGNEFEDSLDVPRWERPDNLLAVCWNSRRNRCAVHTAVRHIDLFVVVRVVSEVDSVDSKGLEPGNLNAQRIGADGKVAKLVASIAAGSHSEDSF